MLYNLSVCNTRENYVNKCLINKITDPMLLDFIYFCTFKRSPEKGWSVKLSNQLLLGDFNSSPFIRTKDYSVVIQAVSFILNSIYSPLFLKHEPLFAEFMNKKNTFLNTPIFAENAKQVKGFIRNRLNANIAYIIKPVNCKVKGLNFGSLDQLLSQKIDCNLTINLILSLIDRINNTNSKSINFNSNWYNFYNMDPYYNFCGQIELKFFSMLHNIMLDQVDKFNCYLKTQYDSSCKNNPRKTDRRILNPIYDKLLKEMKKYYPSKELLALENKRLVTDSLYCPPEYTRFHYIRFGNQFAIGITSTLCNQIDEIRRKIEEFFQKEVGVYLKLEVINIVERDKVSLNCLGYNLQYGYKQIDVTRKGKKVGTKTVRSLLIEELDENNP
jgi:hypothetical protein